MEWLLDACRHYLDDSMEVTRGWQTPRVSQFLAPHLAEYYRLNKAALEREGLGHLLYGEYVISDRATSPDVELEDREDLSAGEKARVLYNALLSINRGGVWSRSGRGGKMYGVVCITAFGVQQARDFFTLNPSASVTPLLQLMAECIELAHGGGSTFRFSRGFLCPARRQSQLFHGASGGHRTQGRPGGYHQFHRNAFLEIMGNARGRISVDRRMAITEPVIKPTGRPTRSAG